jgi:hypothetical protein
MFRWDTELGKWKERLEKTVEDRSTVGWIWVKETGEIDQQMKWNETTTVAPSNAATDVTHGAEGKVDSPDVKCNETKDHWQRKEDVLTRPQGVGFDMGTVVHAASLAGNHGVYFGAPS